MELSPIYHYIYQQRWWPLRNDRQNNVRSSWGGGGGVDVQYLSQMLRSEYFPQPYIHLFMEVVWLCMDTGWITYAVQCCWAVHERWLNFAWMPLETVYDCCLAVCECWLTACIWSKLNCVWMVFKFEYVFHSAVYEWVFFLYQFYIFDARLTC